MKQLIVLVLMLASINCFSQLNPVGTNDTSKNKYPASVSLSSGFTITPSNTDVLIYYPGYLICRQNGDTLTLDSLYNVKFIKYDGMMYEIVRFPAVIQPYNESIQLGGTIFRGSSGSTILQSKPIKKTNTKKSVKSSALNYQSANKQWEKLSSSALHAYSSVRAQSVKIMDSLTSSFTKFLQ